jgi:hypothetical protein
MKSRTAFVVAGVVLLSLVGASAETSHDRSKAESILQDFVEDFQKDPFAEGLSTTFGITIRDVGEWHVTIDGSQVVILEEGAVPVAAPFFISDLETLGRIDRGELGIMTAMGREYMSDKTPMDFGFANNYQLTPDTLAELLPLTFHFWTKGQPEIVKFGELDQARVVHGAYATVFYYEQGFRSGYYRLENGQHINADEAMQANPFPTLIILIGGTMESRIGGEAMTLEGKQAILVPAGVPHEFWNSNDTPAEFIIIMFGDGA